MSWSSQCTMCWLISMTCIATHLCIFYHLKTTEIHLSMPKPQFHNEWQVNKFSKRLFRFLPWHHVSWVQMCKSFQVDGNCRLNCCADIITLDMYDGSIWNWNIFSHNYVVTFSGLKVNYYFRKPRKIFREAASGGKKIPFVT